MWFYLRGPADGRRYPHQTTTNRCDVDEDDNDDSNDADDDADDDGDDDDEIQPCGSI